MKYKLFFILICFVSLAKGQDEVKLQSSLDVFKNNATSYLQELVEREYGDTKDATIIALKDSRLSLLKVKINFVNDQVTKLVADKNITDQNFISKLISKSYKDQFTGIRKEFFDKSEEAVRKL